MPTTYNDPIMLDSTGQDIVDKLDSIASLMGDGVIDDTSTTATDKTWSASKENTVVNGLQSNVIANTKLIKDSLGWSGKNKLQSKLASNTLNGVTFTRNSDDTWTVSGTATADAWMNISGTFKLPEGKYIMNGCPQNGGASSYRLYIREEPQISGGFSVNDYGNGVEFTITSALAQKNLIVFIAAMNGTAITTPIVFKPMIRSADILDDTYEPYFGSTAFPRSEQAVLGAVNFAEIIADSGTVQNVVYTVNKNAGTVSANGLASATATLLVSRAYKEKLGNRVIYIKGCPAGGNKLTKYHQWIGVRNAANTGWLSSYNDEGNGVEIDLTNADYSFVAIEVEVRSGFNAENLLFKPQVCLSLDTPFAPYAMTNQELTDKVNGMVDYVNTTANNGNAYTGSLDDAPLGFVYCSSGCTNNPVNKWGVTETIKASSTAKIQKFYSVETDDFCIRRMVSSAWQAWQKVTTTSVS